jgi:hypothetical protein
MQWDGHTDLRSLEDRNLAEVVGLDRADCGAAVKDASERGWIRGSIGGIGGLHSQPQGTTELTPEGHEQLSDG